MVAALPTRREPDLPDTISTLDDGCHLHAHCLTCPLARCIYDQPAGSRSTVSEQRRARVLELRRCGLTYEAVAREMGISRRQVIRLYLSAHLQDSPGFPGGPGRTRSNELLLQEIDSIKRELYVLPDAVAVYPGHGANTTIGDSKAEYAVFASKPHDADLSGDVLWLES